MSAGIPIYIPQLRVICSNRYFLIWKISFANVQPPERLESTAVIMPPSHRHHCMYMLSCCRSVLGDPMYHVVAIVRLYSSIFIYIYIYIYILCFFYYSPPWSTAGMRAASRVFLLSWHDLCPYNILFRSFERWIPMFVMFTNSIGNGLLVVGYTCA